MYLHRRNGHYWFRKATPIDLVGVLGADVRCSLRTTRRDVARRRAGQLLVALENVYAVLRSETPLEPTKELLGRIARDAVERATSSTGVADLATRRLRQAAAQLGALAPPIATNQQQTLVPVEDIEVVLRREQPRTETNRLAADILGFAAQVRRQSGWSSTDRAGTLISLCQKLVAASEQIGADEPRGLEAIRTIVREEIFRARVGATGNQAPSVDTQALRDVVASEVRAGVAAAGRDRWSTEPLSGAIARFLEAQYPADDRKGKVGSKHRDDVERRLAAFLTFTGDTAVRDVTRDRLKAYRDVLDQLPDRFEARFKTKDMCLAVEKNTQRKVPFPTIGPTTIDLKWLGPVDRLFGWLVTEEKIEKNPVDGIRSQQDAREAANTKRLPFKADQIGKFFAITSAASSQTALYWLPLLMLTTGARPNELAQLRTDDLHANFNGRPHLNVLCLLDDDDETTIPAAANDDKRRVKTAAGRRMIPLHPILIKAGFIPFVQARHKGGAKQLFRELHPDRNGFWSAAITKRLNRIIRVKLGITNPKYSAYSLRHNFIDACRSASIPEETRMKFVGHQLNGTHGIYGKPSVLPHESNLIDSVRFEGIDFAQYVRSGFQESRALEEH